MSWSDIKKRYEAAGGKATQSTEDMFARRLLRALGVTEGALPRIERETGLDAARRGDTTLLERAVALARHRYDGFCTVPLVLDVKTVREAENALLDLAEGVTLRKNLAVVYRKSGDPSVRALVWHGKSTALDIASIPLPCRLFRAFDGETLVSDCDVRDYLAVVMRGSSNG